MNRFRSGPIRIDGGLQVDKLVMLASVTIRSEQPLPVSGTVSVDTPVDHWRTAPRHHWTRQAGGH